MDRIVCVIRKSNFYCLLQTAPNVLKFPQFAVSISDSLIGDKIDLIQDIATPLIQSKYSANLIVNGVVCFKSAVLPLNKERLLAFYVLVDAEQTSFLATEEGDWAWNSFKNLEKKAEKGSFLAEDLNIIKQIENRKLVANYFTVDFKETNKEWTEQQIVDSLTDAQNKLRLSAKYDQQSFSILKQAFISLSFPYESMSQDQFLHFLDAVEMPDLTTNCSRYFRAFDQFRNGRLSFLDFILGCGALELHTTHGGEPGEQRCRYIFRFYCQKFEFNMAFGEFVTMIDDIIELRLNGKPKSAKDSERSVLSQHFSDSFTMTAFLQKVGSLQLRGTSCLFRSQVSIIDKLKDLCQFSEPVEEKEKGKIKLPAPEQIKIPVKNEIIESSEMKSIETEISAKNYIISKHVLQITSSGTVVELMGNVIDSISASSASAISAFSSGENDTPCNMSQDYAKQVLRALDYFRKPYVIDGQKKRALDWDGVIMSSLADCILKLCSAVSVLFKAERRCIEIDDPVYILGDIHGNVNNLFECEQYLWPLSVQFCPAKILLLGDYVDRGQFGVEVVTYLFAQKVLQPDRIFLLRGNHEIRATQKSFDFYNECQKKFGESLGPTVFEAVNNCFDALPLCAVVNKKVFCVHGGIPSPEYYNSFNNIFDAVNAIPLPLNIEDETHNLLAWELMWNDPVWDEDVMAINSRGFAPNYLRGTASVFSSAALNNFLTKHNLSHVVRAHEVKLQGFQIRFSTKLLTVFTSSSYSGMDNNAACLILERGNMRMIQLGRNAGKIQLYEK